MSINQFQMTGDVFVIIRTLVPCTINNISYQEKEVVTSFTADVNVNYTDINTNIKTEKTQLSRNDVYADSVQIVPKHLNDGIYNLIGKRLSGDIAVPNIKTMESNEDGAIFLNASLDPSFFIIKDEQGAILSSYDVNFTNGTITGLTADTSYKLYYYLLKTPIASLTFEDVQLPYMRIELVGKGNINNESKSFLVVIPRAQINSAPQMAFNNSSIINVLLLAKVINIGDIELHYY
jgi:hypothetical protein